MAHNNVLRIRRLMYLVKLMKLAKLVKLVAPPTGARMAAPLSPAWT